MEESGPQKMTNHPDLVLPPDVLGSAACSDCRNPSDFKNHPLITVEKNLSRRTFLKGLAGFLGALTLKPKRALAGHGPVSKAETFGVLVDLTRCISCRACSRACVDANELHPADKGTDVTPAHQETLVFDKWSAVNTFKTQNEKGQDVSVGVKRQCMHCLEPACASVCPVGALTQTELGAVIYRANRCIGCRYCMIACPFDVPKFDWKSGIFPVIGKCQLCAQNRLYRGLSPACTSVCPTGALKFGKRQKLLFEAKVRMKSSPGKYIQHIYGENEVGGTSWLYLSGVPFEKLGFKTKMPSEPLPALTWEVVSKLPIVIAVLAGLFGTVAGSLKKESQSREEVS